MEKDRIIIDILVNLKNEENITLKELENIIESPFKFARETTKNIEFKEMSLEEFRLLKRILICLDLVNCMQKKKYFII